MNHIIIIKLEELSAICVKPVIWKLFTESVTFIVLVILLATYILCLHYAEVPTNMLSEYGWWLYCHIYKDERQSILPHSFDVQRLSHQPLHTLKQFRSQTKCSGFTKFVERSSTRCRLHVQPLHPSQTAATTALPLVCTALKPKVQSMNPARNIFLLTTTFVCSCTHMRAPKVQSYSMQHTTAST